MDIDDLKDRVLGTVDIIDAADEARRLFGEEALERLMGHPVPEHDYRFQITSPSGGVTTFARNDTAADVMRSIQA